MEIEGDRKEVKEDYTSGNHSFVILLLIKYFYYCK